MRVDFGGEGEWKITRDVFRDLGLAFLGVGAKGTMRGSRAVITETFAVPGSCLP